MLVKAEEDIAMETKTYTVKASGGVAYQTPSYQLGGTGGCAAAISANMAITGNTTQNGSITSTGDQVAGGISQTGHTHPGCQGGSTGAPQ